MPRPSPHKQDEMAVHTLILCCLFLIVGGGYLLYQSQRNNPNLVVVETCVEGRMEAGVPSLVLMRLEYARILGMDDEYCLGTLSPEVAVPSYEGTPLTSQAYDFTYWRSLSCASERRFVTCPLEDSKDDSP